MQDHFLERVSFVPSTPRYVNRKEGSTLNSRLLSVRGADKFFPKIQTFQPNIKKIVGLQHFPLGLSGLPPFHLKLSNMFDHFLTREKCITNHSSFFFNYFQRKGPPGHRFAPQRKYLIPETSSINTTSVYTHHISTPKIVSSIPEPLKKAQTTYILSSSILINQ